MYRIYMYGYIYTDISIYIYMYREDLYTIASLNHDDPLGGYLLKDHDNLIKI
jgi:hypothetical protein